MIKPAGHWFVSYTNNFVNLRLRTVSENNFFLCSLSINQSWIKFLRINYNNNNYNYFVITPLDYHPFLLFTYFYMCVMLCVSVCLCQFLMYFENVQWTSIELKCGQCMGLSVFPSVLEDSNSKFNQIVFRFFSPSVSVYD